MRRVKRLSKENLMGIDNGDCQREGGMGKVEHKEGINGD